MPEEINKRTIYYAGDNVMKYVFDSGPLIDLFRHYYPSRFPTLWEKFHDLVLEEELISVRDVYNEINSREDTLTSWAKKDKDKIFSQPTVEEFHFVSEIFQVQHFQAMIRKQKNASRQSCS